MNDVQIYSRLHSKGNRQVGDVFAIAI